MATPTSPATPPSETDAPLAPALQAIDLVAGGSDPLSLAAPPGAVTLWPGDDRAGTAELALALSGRFHPVSGTVRVLDRDTEPGLLRREVVPARVTDAIEPESRLRVTEYLASCAILHGTRHNRISAEQALADVGFAADPRLSVGELVPADAVRVAVAGALLARPVAVIVDRVDRGISGADWPELLADLRRAAELTGVAVVASATRDAEADR